MREKNSIRSKAMCAALTIFLGLMVFPLAAFAAIGSITSVNGQVSILRGGQLPAVTAAVGTEVNVGDFVRTKSSSGCEIRFTDGNVIKVGPRSRIDISEYAIDRDTRTIGLTRGKVEAIVVPPPKRDNQLQPKRFEIHSPNAVAGVRGTDLLVFYEGSTTGILVISLHGGDNVYAYSLSNPDQLIDLPAGFITYIRDNQLPTPGRQATEAEINALIRELLARMGIDPDTLLAGLGTGNEMLDVPVTDTFPGLLETAYEVGQFSLSGGTGITDFNIDNMTVKFLSPTAGGAPTTWLSTDILGSWSDQGPIVVGSSIPLTSSGTTGWASADFTFTGWNTTNGRWSADISGYGDGVTTGGEYIIDFSGKGAGGGATDNWFGTFTGTASGTVVSSPFAP